MKRRARSVWGRHYGIQPKSSETDGDRTPSAEKETR